MTKLAIAGLCCVLTTSAAAYPYKAHVSQCYGNRDQWTASVGRKVQEIHEFGAFLVATIQWDNGAVSEVTVGPYEDQFCILAEQLITPAPGI